MNAHATPPINLNAKDSSIKVVLSFTHIKHPNPTIDALCMIIPIYMERLLPILPNLVPMRNEVSTNETENRLMTTPTIDELIPLSFLATLG